MNVFRTAVPLFLGLLFLVTPAMAEEDFSTSEEKAQRAHERSMSDVMYQQEDFRAIYYQNEAMIQLLKEIKEEIHAVNMRGAKQEQKT